ncbi:hypothetical protein [Mesorhizobium sp.]|uniref:hypothetical protein n=1 Tax=Mesorhizobium sp. TaxID=1871066 RepID=UPI00257C12C8|nr:hypothetical protein [Mesorhizobium sp.]
MMERATNTIAAGAAVSPFWLPSLADVSQGAALLLPVLGCVWLIVQIITRITQK